MTPPIPQMPRSALDYYMLAIRLAAEGVTRAGRIIDDAASVIRHGVDRDYYDDPTDEQLWDGVLSLIAHSAALSRVFWPQGVRKVSGESPTQLAARKRRRRKRAAELREWFVMQRPGGRRNPLHERANSRTLRNTLEHWDERIEDWHTDVHGRKAVDSWFGTPDPPDTGEFYIVRAYDYRTRTVTVGGRESMELTPVIDEAKRILELWAVLRRHVPPPSSAAPYPGSSAP